MVRLLCGNFEKSIILFNGYLLDILVVLYHSNLCMDTTTPTPSVLPMLFFTTVTVSIVSFVTFPAFAVTRIPLWLNIKNSFYI